MSIIKGSVLTDVERTFLEELVASGTSFMIVGMSAADLQGANIGTQDIDLWFRSTSDGGLDRAARAAGSMFNSFRSILGIGANTKSLTYEELYDPECKHSSFADVHFVGE